MIKRQFLRFIVVGIFSTVINYSVFYVLYGLLGLNYLLSSAIGFIVGVFVGYNFNKSWTFDVTENSKYYIIKYYIVYTFSLILGLIFLSILVEPLVIIPYIANILTIGLTTCTNFLGTKLLVFRK